MECTQEADRVDDVLPSGIQIQGRVNQRDASPDAEVSVLPPQLVQRPVNRGPALGFLLLREQGELLHLPSRRQSSATSSRTKKSH